MPEVDLHQWMSLTNKIDALNGKIVSAESWFNTIDPASPIFDKGFDRYRTLINQRATLYLEEYEPEQMTL